MTDVFAPRRKVVHVDLNAYEIAKNFPVDLGLVADPKLTLAALADAAGRHAGPPAAAGRRGRVSMRAAKRSERSWSGSSTHDNAVRDEVPCTRRASWRNWRSRRRPDAIIFDEALTTSPDVTRYLPPTLPGHFFQTRGGSLGVGIPGAIGVKLAHPDKTVIGFTGDGGSMYTIQALWTAARYNIAAKFVICNNQSYMLLKLNILEYWADQVGVQRHAFPTGFDLDKPVIDFAQLSMSMGVEAVSVDHPDQVPVAIKQMLAHDGPFLVNLIISNQIPG